jgi:hypothetical protein
VALSLPKLRLASKELYLTAEANGARYAGGMIRETRMAPQDHATAIPRLSFEFGDTACNSHGWSPVAWQQRRFLRISMMVPMTRARARAYCGEIV